MTFYQFKKVIKIQTIKQTAISNRMNFIIISKTFLIFLLVYLWI